jgi:transcriptional regulator with XRE-family HTH domain
MLVSKYFVRFVRNAEAARKARGLSRDDVAAKLGVKRQAIDPVLTGRECPTMDRAERIADAIGVPLYRLISPRKAK